MKRKPMLVTAWMLTLTLIFGAIGAFGETLPASVRDEIPETTVFPDGAADMSDQPAHPPAVFPVEAATENTPVPDTTADEVTSVETPEVSVAPAVSEPTTLEALPTASEVPSMEVPAAASTPVSFTKGYVAVSAGTWFYTNRYAGVSKQFFQTAGDAFGYAFDARINSQGELWAEVGFAIRRGAQWEMQVGYVPANWLRMLGDQPDPEWVSQPSSVSGAYYLINGKADRPLPPASLKIAPQPTPAAASSAPEGNTPCPTATEITETPSAAQNASETQLSEEMLSAWPADTPSPWPTSSPDHAQILHASANGDGSAIIPAVPEVQKERPDPEGSALIATSSDLTSASKKVWIEVERPVSGLYRGDEVILRAKAEGFENVPIFQWEYRPSQKEDWIIYPLTEDKSHDTITLEVNSENVSWQWRVIAK